MNDYPGRPDPPPEADNNNNNNPRLIPEAHRLESLEQWLEVHGLPAPVDEERWERVQDRQRVAEAQAYQKAIHRQVFGSDDDDDDDDGNDYYDKNDPAQQAKQAQLQAWRDAQCGLTVTCSDQVVLPPLDLVPLAASCDFIYALAASWRHFQQASNDDEDEEHSTVVVQLNLPEFAAHHVQLFVDIVNQTQSLHQVPSGSDIVEVCKLAHFLQNTQLLQETEQILLHSIDTANCLALTQLADSLHLPRLFEASLAHMMQSVHDLEQGECWDHFTPELRNRIAAIRSAIQSSIHDQRSVLYFASLQEYLAIFAERVHYYKERLAEAMEQQASRDPSPAWWDAQRKIERQRTRLHTLQTAFAEQKKLFGRNYLS